MKARCDQCNTCMHTAYQINRRWVCKHCCYGKATTSVPVKGTLCEQCGFVTDNPTHHARVCPAVRLRCPLCSEHVKNDAYSVLQHALEHNARKLPTKMSNLSTERASRLYWHIGSHNIPVLIAVIHEPLRQKHKIAIRISCHVMATPTHFELLHYGTLSKGVETAVDPFVGMIVDSHRLTNAKLHWNLSPSKHAPPEMYMDIQKRNGICYICREHATIITMGCDCKGGYCNLYTCAGHPKLQHRCPTCKHRCKQFAYDMIANRI